MVEGNIENAAIGIAQIEHLDAKKRLELFACTECGRCSEHCPATRTGKSLSPKLLTLAMREQLKREAPRLLGKSQTPPSSLVPQVLDPRTLWACTTCRACEEQCPVGVNYLDSIVGLRRNLVLMRGEAPPELHRVFDGMERNFNPWNFPKSERGKWANGLDVPLLSEVEHVDYLYWVGCAASYDERGKSIARAMARLMKRAGASFAILGAEERCTGDSARRAGNELLFLQLAEQNIELLNRYQSQHKFSEIVTTCPHCLHTLSREYRDLGANFAVVHHSVLLSQWLKEGRLQPNRAVAQSAVFHDPCTLARYAGITREPRAVLSALPNIQLREPLHHRRNTLCCGAGGAQMWLEEQNQHRMHVARAKELLDTEAEQVVSGCPFCATMLTDALGDLGPLGNSSGFRVRDLAELLDMATAEAP